MSEMLHTGYEAVLVSGKIPINLFDAFGKRVPNVDFTDRLAHDLTQSGVSTRMFYTAQSPQRFYDDINSKLQSVVDHKRLILVGHSAGATAVIRYLSENPDFESALNILVAPTGGYNWPIGERQLFDFNLRLRDDKPNVFMHSHTDTLPIRNYAQYLRDVRAQDEHIEFADAKHFCQGTTVDGRMPEVLQLVQKVKSDFTLAA